MPAWLLPILEALAPTLLQAIIDALKGNKSAQVEINSAIEVKLAKYETALNAIK